MKIKWQSMLNDFFFSMLLSIELYHAWTLFIILSNFKIPNFYWNFWRKIGNRKGTKFWNWKPQKFWSFFIHLSWKNRQNISKSIKFYDWGPQILRLKRTVKSRGGRLPHPLRHAPAYGLVIEFVLIVAWSEAEYSTTF